MWKLTLLIHTCCYDKNTHYLLTDNFGFFMEVLKQIDTKAIDSYFSSGSKLPLVLTKPFTSPRSVNR